MLFSTDSIGSPSSPVSVSHSVDSCSGVTMTINSSTEFIQDVTYSVYYDNDTLYTSTIVNNITIVPPSVFHNHTSVYTIVITPSNLAGEGPTTIITIDLAQANYCKLLKMILYNN